MGGQPTTTGPPARPEGLSIAVLYGAVAPDAPPDEQDALVEVDAVATALRSLGHRPAPIPLTLDLAAARSALAELAPDLVFNLVESVAGQGALIYLGGGLLEALGLPFTGAGTGALLNTSNKRLAKRALGLAGIATPIWFDTQGAAPPARGGPWIVKSVWEHASIGLDDGAVVPDVEAATRLLGRRAEDRAGEWFAEAYVDGRELNVPLLAGPDGPEVLPISEIRFEHWPAGKPRIVNYAAKWLHDAFEYNHTPRVFHHAAGDSDLLAELRRTALQCWYLFELRGHARVDFRVDRRGRPWVLEVNTNPCLAPDAGFAAALTEAGIDFAEALERILAEASGGGGARRPLGATEGPGGPQRASILAHASERRAGPRQASILPGAPWRRVDAQRAASPAHPAGPVERDLTGVAYREGPRLADRAAVQALVASTGFFSEAEVAISVELVDECLARGHASGYEFLFAEAGGDVLGYTCYGPIAGTTASWDLYWIAVTPARQGRGHGVALLARTEALIRAAGGRQLYADTSSRPQYAPTRDFYERNGFVRAAILTDFYGPGDGKVIYCKRLADAPRDQ